MFSEFAPAFTDSVDDQLLDPHLTLLKITYNCLENDNTTKPPQEKFAVSTKGAGICHRSVGMNLQQRTIMSYINTKDCDKYGACDSPLDEVTLMSLNMTRVEVSTMISMGCCPAREPTLPLPGRSESDSVVASNVTL